jgi:hypothetical protein
MVRVAPFGVNGEAGSASLSSRSESAVSEAISFTASITAETPIWVWLEWASRPVTVQRKVAIPLWPFTATMLVGSPTKTQAGAGSSRRITSIISGAPRQPISSSYEKARCTGFFGRAATSSGVAASARARNPFMSQVPRP